MFDLIVLVICLAIVAPAALLAGFAFAVWLETIAAIPLWVPAWVLAIERVVRHWAMGR